MQDAASITFRLESYLMRLSEMLHRWRQWLQQSDEAIVGRQFDQLQATSPIADQIMFDFQEMLQDRKQLLEDDDQEGYPSHDLSVLARSLPAWRKPTLRRSIAAAKSQVGQLRRLHIATWVLMHQMRQHHLDMMQILNHSENQKSVYLTSSTTDMQGGRLLDESL